MTGGEWNRPLKMMHLPVIPMDAMTEPPPLWRPSPHRFRSNRRGTHHADGSVVRKNQTARGSGPRGANEGCCRMTAPSWPKA